MMDRTIRSLVTLGIAGLALVGLSCTNNEIDDGDSADVFLEVTAFNAPPGDGRHRRETTGICTLTLTNATATFANKRKADLVGSTPLQDIIVETVDIVYQWDDGYAMDPRTFYLGVTVPVAGSGSAQFPVFAVGDLVAAHARAHAATDTRRTS